MLFRLLIRVDIITASLSGGNMPIADTHGSAAASPEIWQLFLNIF